MAIEVAWIFLMWCCSPLDAELPVEGMSVKRRTRGASGHDVSLIIRLCVAPGSVGAGRLASGVFSIGCS